MCYEILSFRDSSSFIAFKKTRVVILLPILPLDLTMWPSFPLPPSLASCLNISLRFASWSFSYLSECLLFTQIWESPVTITGLLYIILYLKFWKGNQCRFKEIKEMFHICYFVCVCFFYFFFIFYFFLFFFFGLFYQKLLKFIMKTCLYNFDRLKLHFYIVKLGFTGVYIIFLISAQKHRLWVLVRTASLRWY